MYKVSYKGGKSEYFSNIGDANNKAVRLSKMGFDAKLQKVSIKNKLSMPYKKKSRKRIVKKSSRTKMGSKKYSRSTTKPLPLSDYKKLSPRAKKSLNGFIKKMSRKIKSC